MSTPQHASGTLTLAAATAFPVPMLVGDGSYAIVNNDTETVYFSFSSNVSDSAGIAIPSGRSISVNEVNYQSAGAGTIIYLYSVAGTSSVFYTAATGAVIDLGAAMSSSDPTGPAGGDLTGTYPDPTIGTKKVTTAKINDAAVTATQLASDAVTTVKILDANVTAGKLASDSVTTAKILDANVTAGKIASDAVTTIKILNGNITSAKLANLVQFQMNTVTIVDHTSTIPTTKNVAFIGTAPGGITRLDGAAPIDVGLTTGQALFLFNASSGVVSIPGDGSNGVLNANGTDLVLPAGQGTYYFWADVAGGFWVQMETYGANNVRPPVRGVSSTATIAINDGTLNCTSGTFTATLPDATQCRGGIYRVRNSGVGLITVACTGGQTINSAPTVTVATTVCTSFQSDGVNWITI